METKLAVFKGKEIRKTLYNNEWWFVVERVQKIEEPEYAILTAEISKAAFGVTPSEYKELKGLQLDRKTPDAFYFENLPTLHCAA
ncbi:MAG: hypothetical protein Q8P84_02690 [Deltaproteobacteria bacterium]|nr:hypothetical protein [Deltaproteobacteria bacterium]